MDQTTIALLQETANSLLEISRDCNGIPSLSYNTGKLANDLHAYVTNIQQKQTADIAAGKGSVATRIAEEIRVYTEILGQDPKNNLAKNNIEIRLQILKQLSPVKYSQEEQYSGRKLNRLYGKYFSYVDSDTIHVVTPTHRINFIEAIKAKDIHCLIKREGLEGLECFVQVDKAGYVGLFFNDLKLHGSSVQYCLRLVNANATGLDSNPYLELNKIQNKLENIEYTIQSNEYVKHNVVEKAVEQLFSELDIPVIGNTETASNIFIEQEIRALMQRKFSSSVSSAADKIKDVPNAPKYYSKCGKGKTMYSKTGHGGEISFSMDIETNLLQSLDYRLYLPKFNDGVPDQNRTIEIHYHKETGFYVRYYNGTGRNITMSTLGFILENLEQEDFEYTS